jgi:hypothetical protein
MDDTTTTSTSTSFSTSERRGLGEFRILLMLDVVALVLIRGDNRAPG